jgi:hypothetical protein
MFRRFGNNVKSFFKRRNSTYDHTTTSTTSSTSITQDIGLGITFLTFGIPVLALNERRANAQNKLREKSEKICEEVDPKIEEEIQTKDNKLVHTVGLVDLSNKETFPKDEVFGITKKTTPKALKIKRHVAMYQWVEHSQETKKKDKDGNEVVETTYTYTKEWSTKHETFQSSSSQCPRNPNFPSGLSGGDFVSEADVKLEKIEISKTFNKEYVNDYIDLPLKSSEIELKEAFGLKQDGESNYYSGKGKFSHPEIGDINVSFTYVPENVYSGVGKLKNSSLDYFKGQLKTKLKDQGPIQVPNKEINELMDAATGTSGSERKFQFFIPESVIDMAESFLLTFAPLQIGYLKKGNHNKTQMFDFIKKKDEETTILFRAVGFIIVYVGCSFVLGPFGKVAQFIPKGKTAVSGTALGSATLITYKTIEMNQTPGEKEKGDIEID